jgi:hypothetical protein
LGDTVAETYNVVSAKQHNHLVEVAYRRRGYATDEAADAARLCAAASTHGIRTHNAIKALHLDHLFGSRGTANRSTLLFQKPVAVRGRAVAQTNPNRRWSYSPRGF